MNNEDRIVEFLAESLQRLDRHEQLFEKIAQKLDKYDNTLYKLVDGQNRLIPQNE